MRESPWDLPDAARPRLLRCTLAPPVKGSLAVTGLAEVASSEIGSRKRRDRQREASAKVEHLGTPSFDQDPVLSKAGPDQGTAQESSQQAADDPSQHSATIVAAPSPTMPAGAHVVDPSGISSENGERPSQVSAQINDDFTHVAEPNADEPTRNHDHGSSPMKEPTPLDESTIIAQPTKIDKTSQTPKPSQTTVVAETIEQTSPKSHPQPLQTASVAEVASPTPTPPQVPPTPSRSTRDRPAKPATNATTTAKPPMPRPPKVMHVRPDLVPITRFHRRDLEAHWTKLLSFVLDGEDLSDEDRVRWLGLEDDAELRNEVKNYIAKYAHKSVNGPLKESDNANGTSNGNGDTTAKYYTKSTMSDAGVPAIPDPAGLEAQSHAFMLVSADELDNNLFDRLWAKGEPMVVDRVGSRFKQTWTPDAFIQRFGQEACRKLPVSIGASPKYL